MWTSGFRFTPFFVPLSPFCSPVSCVISGRMPPKTGTTTNGITSITKSRRGNRGKTNKYQTYGIMGTTEHEEPKFFFILNKGAKSGGEIYHPRDYLMSFIFPLIAFMIQPLGLLFSRDFPFRIASSPIRSAIFSCAVINVSLFRFISSDVKPQE